VKSPCIGVCVLDMADICEGCFRSTEEIANWSALEREQQIEVLRRSLHRAKAANRLL